MLTVSFFIDSLFQLKEISYYQLTGFLNSELTLNIIKCSFFIYLHAHLVLVLYLYNKVYYID